MSFGGESTFGSFGQPAISNTPTAFDKPSSEGGAIGGFGNKDQVAHQGEKNSTSRETPSSSKPIVGRGNSGSGNRGGVLACVNTNPLRAVNPPNTLQHQFNPHIAQEKEHYSEEPNDHFYHHISFQLTAWSADEVRLADYNAHAERKAIKPPTAENNNGSNKHDSLLGKHLTPQNLEHTSKSHDSQMQPVAKREDTPQPSATKSLDMIVIPDEEQLRVNNDLYQSDMPKVERLSASFAKKLRPILHGYLRDEVEALSKTAMNNMKKRIVQLLSSQQNSHFGFATLRDVEIQTLVTMGDEVNSARKAFLEQIDGFNKQNSDLPIKRDASDLEEGEVTEDSRDTKRQRIPNSADSQN
ncbi:hypothetical protein CGCSCA5_v012892 [Colletotrichum siamense]|nr:hypothetical protein CGCSCA5_v012892 [Colletotrichum siamense]